MLQTQPEHTTERSLSIRLLQRVEHLVTTPQFICVLFSLVFALLAGIVGVRLARQYHTFTMYYPDSSAYRQQAVLVYQTLHTSGYGAALRQAALLKDGLDIILRLLFFPEMLRTRFGHLAVLLPFLSLFVGLTLWLVVSRTRSRLSGIVVVAFLCSSGLLYGPYAGIADYWKDSLGTWLLGSACITWLLSERLSRAFWSFVCGLLLGLLLLQRTGAAVYAAPLFVAVFLPATYVRIRADGWKPALQRVVIFAAPALTLLVILVALQLQFLYTYYFGLGYAYGSMQFIASSLLQSMLAYGGWITYLVPIACVVAAAGVADWQAQRADIVTVLWFVAGFPLMIILSKSSYLPGFYACWVVLLIVLLAVMIPKTASASYARLGLPVLVMLALGGSVAQYGSAVLKANLPDQVSQATRRFYIQIANSLFSQPAPRVYKLLFYEAGADFWNLMYFDMNREQALQTLDSAAFISVHDSYYQATFVGRTTEQIVKQNIERLEQVPGTIVVADCNPQKIYTRTWFAPNPALDYLKNGNPLAANIAIQLTQYVLSSSHWRALNKIDSPFGCMYMYQYSVKPLTTTEKWRQVSFSAQLTDLPVTLGLGTNVHLYDYSSRYAPEQVNGLYYQWLPAGTSGLQLALYTEKAATVLLQAHAIPGPARSDTKRTLIITSGSRTMKLEISVEQDIRMPIELEPGLNQIEFAVGEAATVPAANGDARELMLLLVAPHLVDQP